MTLSKGDVVDRYVIDGPLGSGGMGEVYRARDTRLQRNVALKILRLDVASGSLDSRERTGPTDGAAAMLREARAAAALDHPNVVAIFDVGQITDDGPLKGTTYLAMELIKGRSLRAFVGDASVPVRQRLRWLADAARALGSAHDAGLVHRDVKPDNVMVRDDGVVKVLDFGIARRARNAPVNPTGWTEQVATAPATQPGIVVGTPIYLAPEQMRSEPLDGRADQFAWGVMAYEVLTGAVPWRTDDPITLLSQILTARPPSLDTHVEIPPHVRAAVLRTLEKDRDHRFASMADVVTALEGEADPYAPTDSKIATGKIVVSARVAAPAGVSVAPTERASIPDAVPPSPPVETHRALSSTRPVASRTTRRPRFLVASSVALVCVALAGGVVWRASRASRATASAPAASSTPAACTGSRACVDAHGGEAWVCRASDHQCAPVASPDCVAKVEAGDLEHDDLVWLGALFPLKGEQAAAFGQMNANGVDLARKEIAEATRSLANDGSAQHVRRIALALCDDSADGLRAAKHLADDLRVPAILGFKSGQEVVDVAGGLLIKHGVMTVASLTPSPLITRLPQGAGPRLVWRTTFGYDALAEATAAFVASSLEKRVKRTDGPVRIALVRLATTTNSAFADRFFDKLVFNGKRAVDNGRDYQEVVLPPGATDDARLAAAVTSIDAQAPSIVVFLVDDATEVALAVAVERGWSAAGRPLPLLVGVNQSTAVLGAYVGTSAARRHRVLAIDSVSGTVENAHFVFRYNAAYTPSVSRWFNPASSYDAFYVLAYASIAAGGDALTGGSLARSIPRLLPPGIATEVGPGGVLPAVSALTSGGTIDLRGAATALDFDTSTGEARVDLALLCPDVDASGRADGDHESGLVFHSATGEVTGELRCR